MGRHGAIWFAEPWRFDPRFTGVATLERFGSQHQVVKVAFADGLPLKIALAMAMGDLMQNWERYRAAFLEGAP